MEDNDIQQVVRSVATIVENIRTFALAREATEAAAGLRTVLERLQTVQLNVVVCGEFKQGKTSLLAALLCEPSLLPIDTDIATAAVTRIAWGEAERITAYVNDNGQTREETLTRTQLWEFIAQINNEDKGRRVQLVNIELPNPLLAGGLVLIDTPGIGGIAIEHSEITYGFLPQADLVLFITSAQAPMTDHEVTFLQKRVAPFRRDVFVVLNRIDRQRDWRTIADSNRAKLEQAFGDGANGIPILPCSSGQYLSFLQSHDPFDAEESLVPQVEAAIVGHVRANGATVSALRAIDGAQKILGEMRAPVQTAHAALGASSEQEIQALKDELNETRMRLDELKGQRASWRMELAQGFVDIRQALIYEQQEGYQTLRADFNRRLADPKELNDPGRIGRDTAADLQTHRAILNQTAMDLVIALRLKVAISARITLPGSGDMRENSAIAGDAPGLHEARKKQGMGRRVFSTGRTALASTTSGGAMGTVAGGVIGGVIGAIFGGIGAVPGATFGSYLGGALGSLLGGYHGVREGLDLINQRDAAETRKAMFDILDPYISSELLRIHRGQADALRDAERATTAEFETEIDTASRINRDQISALTEQVATKQTNVASRMAELKVALAAMSGYEAQLHTAATELSGKSQNAAGGSESAEEDSWLDETTRSVGEMGIDG